MSEILLMQPQLDPPGGGNGVAAWMLQALRDAHRLTLLCWRRPDLARVNATFGTALEPSDFEVRTVPGPLDRVVIRLGLNLELLRMAFMCRHATRMAPRYDVVLTANNEVNVGRRVIQYVHYPRFLLPRPGEDYRWYNRQAWAHRAYYAACSRLAGLNAREAGKNLTLVNSRYVQSLTEPVLGSATTVLHPPACNRRGTRPWGEREQAVVCVGRLAPVKRIGDIIDIVSRLRGLGHELVLHIAGNRDDGAYASRLEAQVSRHPWARLHVDLSRETLDALMERCRFGLHGMRGEHFGMAVAEMQRAGCLVFVPDEGGCAEIVANEALTFSGVDDAVEKMGRAISSASHQGALLEDQTRHRERFGPEVFCRGLREIVERFVHEGSTQDAGA